MDFFRNRLVACVLAVLVVAGSAVINTQVKLGEKCQEVEDGFYTSQSGEKSIYARLDERLDASNGVWSLLVNRDTDAANSLSEARSELISAYDAKDISEMYDANKSLETAFDSAAAVLAACELDSGEIDAMNSYIESFDGAQKMIDRSSYNSTVLEFVRTVYNKFPASLLAPVAGVDSPELFE